MIPRDDKKLDRSQNTTKLAGMTCHLMNKVVMKQNCIEALNQHAELLIIIVFCYFILVTVFGAISCLEM